MSSAIRKLNFGRKTLEGVLRVINVVKRHIYSICNIIALSIVVI